MEILRKGRVHYLAAFNNRTFAPVVAAGFTTRHEGVSRTPYNSLNLGTNTDDAAHNVEGNRSLFTRAFGLELGRLVTVQQNHGTDILVIDAPNQDFAHFLGLEADAIITNQTDLMIGVTVADCLPLLLFDPVKQVVASVHAGWQGTAASIAAKAAQAMISLFDCKATDIVAAIGPSIKACCYEVDQPVKDSFDDCKSSPWDCIAESSSTGKWKLDLALANRMQLEDCGILSANIEATDHCTCCQKDLYFSYRRDNGETGRQVGFIMLKGS